MEKKVIFKRMDICHRDSYLKLEIFNALEMFTLKNPIKILTRDSIPLEIFLYIYIFYIFILNNDILYDIVFMFNQEKKN